MRPRLPRGPSRCFGNPDAPGVKSFHQPLLLRSCHDFGSRPHGCNLLIKRDMGGGYGQVGSPEQRSGSLGSPESPLAFGHTQDCSAKVGAWIMNMVTLSWSTLTALWCQFSNRTIWVLDLPKLRQKKSWRQTEDLDTWWFLFLKGTDKPLDLKTDLL